MKTAYFWLTPQGKQLAEQLQAHFGGTVEPKADFAETVRRAFTDCDAGEMLVQLCIKEFPIAFPQSNAHTETANAFYTSIKTVFQNAAEILLCII